MFKKVNLIIQLYHFVCLFCVDILINFIHMILKIDAIDFLTNWLAGAKVAAKAHNIDRTRISIVANHGNQNAALPCFMNKFSYKVIVKPTTVPTKIPRRQDANTRISAS